MTTYHYELEGAATSPRPFEAENDEEALKTAQNYASLKGDKLIMLYVEEGSDIRTIYYKD